ncbi:MAG: hypothetical protein ACFB0B_20745 [Thermonemataceae bacterium]
MKTNIQKIIDHAYTDDEATIEVAKSLCRSQGIFTDLATMVRSNYELGINRNVAYIDVKGYSSLHTKVHESLSFGHMVEEYMQQGMSERQAADLLIDGHTLTLSAQGKSQFSSQITFRYTLQRKKAPKIIYTYEFGVHLEGHATALLQEIEATKKTHPEQYQNNCIDFWGNPVELMDETYKSTTTTANKV